MRKRFRVLIRLAVVFLVRALLGTPGIAGSSMEMGKIPVIIFIISAVITFLFGGLWEFSG